jgi:hypothetical protein
MSTDVLVASTYLRRSPRTVRAVGAVVLEVIAWMLIVSGSCASGCSWWATRAQRNVGQQAVAYPRSYSALDR